MQTAYETYVISGSKNRFMWHVKLSLSVSHLKVLTKSCTSLHRRLFTLLSLAQRKSPKINVSARDS